MKLITSQLVQICAAAMAVLILPQTAFAQVPPVVDPQPDPVNVPANYPGNIVAVSRIKVSCQDLKTVVQKEDRTAVMMTWKTNYFGGKFNNAKRCQIVSQRLQKASDLNNGTFRDLNLTIGTLRSQTVICVLKDTSEKCSDENLLLTLKPENAINPNAVIQQFTTFAAEGTGGVEESARAKSVDLNLGHWERKAFGLPKPKTPAPAKRPSGGF